MGETLTLDIDDTKDELGKYSGSMSTDDLDNVIADILPPSDFIEYKTLNNNEKIARLLLYVDNEYVTEIEESYSEEADEISSELENIRILTKTDVRVDSFIDEIASMFVNIDQIFAKTDLSDEDKDIIDIIFAVCLDLLA